MTSQQYLEIKKELVKRGYEGEIRWSEDIKPCRSALVFTEEYIWVVLNSGMKNQIAASIAGKIYPALKEGKDLKEVFGHVGKRRAIEEVWNSRALYFWEYWISKEKVEYLKTLPWIGPITCWHLAKNLGHNVVKPDRHLVRISKSVGKTPDQLCKEIAKETGDRVATVDLVVWRAANLSLL